jgi:hypothetical protein
MKLFIKEKRKINFRGGGCIIIFVDVFDLYQKRFLTSKSNLKIILDLQIKEVFDD